MASTLRMRGQLLLASLSAATSQITKSRIDPAEINDERLGWFNLVPRVRVTLEQRTGKIIPEVPVARSAGQGLRDWAVFLFPARGYREGMFNDLRQKGQ